MARLFGGLMKLSAVTICGVLLCAVIAPCDAKYIEQKPIFDTTYLPKKHAPFQIGIKHTNIIYPLDLQLRGDARVVNLSTGAHEDSSFLRGGLTEFAPTSAIHTVEHGIQSQFHLDLSALIPQIAPDISRQLDAEIEKAQRSLHGQAIAMPPVQPKAPVTIPQAPRVAPVMPDLVARANVPNIPKAPAQRLPSIADRARTAATKGTAVPASGAPSLGLGLGMGGGGGGGAIAGGGGSAGGDIKMPVPKTNAKVAIPTTNVTVRMPAIDARINVPSIQPQTAVQVKMPSNSSPSSDVAAQLRSAETNAKLLAQNAQPNLDALRARAALLPQAKLPSATTDVNGEVIGRTAIVWDAWHKQFAKIAGDALIKFVNKSNNPLGANTVSVTVTFDQHIKVSIAKPGNASFDAASVEAYRSLNGNAALAFPRGSVRSSVTFLVDNKHTKEGMATVVNSKTLSGDKEVLR
jgi:hypothetical protein